MARTRRRAGALVAIATLATAACVTKGSDVVNTMAEAGVREIAVGTWHCIQTWDGEVEVDGFYGVTSDGRFGVGETAELTEAGTWELDGLKVEIELPMSFQGVPMTASLSYTGDADPPTEIDVVDHLDGDSRGHFDVTVASDRFTAEQEFTGGDGTAHTKRHECDKESSDEPELRSP